MFFKFAYWLVYIVLKPIYRFRITGREKIPPGGALICGNHTALVDAVLVVLALGSSPQVAIMAKQELFRIPLLGFILKKVGVFPINRGNADVSAIKFSMQSLKNGLKLVLFPEGTRVKEAKNREIKPGAGMLALRVGAPVVPVYISAGKKAFRGCRVIFGEPFEPQCDRKPVAEDYQRASNEIMERVFALAPNQLKD